MEIVQVILLFVGGIAMFVYGMQVMADGLQQAAGEKTRHLLEVLTNNRLLGVLVGALVTAIIQSSGATTVMVVGFVNAGLMSLSQAVGVIMGANIGTTMTAWIVSLSEWGAFLKPEMIAPLLLAIGVVCNMTLKNTRAKEAANILIGFGLLFMGLSTMSNAVTPYADAPIFTQIFTVIGGNPILGLLTGMVVTAVMQSSSASMGILQTLALTGIVNWGSAVFIALGQNIGTCVVALISAVGADRNAKRAAFIHLEFNVLGSLIIGTAAWIFFMFNPAVMQAHVTSTGLAIFHTSFNVITTLILLPFANWLVWLSGLLVREKTSQPETSHLVRLDSRLLEQPHIALGVIRSEMEYMGKLALENIGYSRDCLLDNRGFEKLAKNEQEVDEFYAKIGDFIGKMDQTKLTDKERRILRHDLLALRDIEHTSDRCMEISDMAQTYIQEKHFSDQAMEDLNTISSQCEQAFRKALELMKTKDPALVANILQYESKIDSMETFMRGGHLSTLEENGSSVLDSVIYLEALDRYERIADHAKLLCHYVASEEGIAETLPAPTA